MGSLLVFLRLYCSLSIQPGGANGSVSQDINFFIADIMSLGVAIFLWKVMSQNVYVVVTKRSALHHVLPRGRRRSQI